MKDSTFQLTFSKISSQLILKYNAETSVIHH